VKFGVQHPNFSYDGKGEQIVDTLKRLTGAAERSGYDSFWVMDHFHQIGTVGGEEEPMLEGWATIAAMAGFTSKIRLGTLVTGNIYRYPSILAKIGATVDVLSKGRLFMGIGAAWNELESKAYGIPYPPPTKERFRRLEEAVQIIRKMWTEERTSFNGHYYNLQNAYCNPKPIQKPHPPIMIGGSGEQETLRLVAKYADACNIFGSTTTVKRKLDVLREHCKTAGRDYDTITKSRLGMVLIDNDKEALEKRLEERFKGADEQMRQRMGEFVTMGTPEEVRRQVESFRDVGIEYFITSFEPGREQQGLEQFADEVVKKV
jgi:F420-dependent oxidoreductase-like protein